MMKLKKGMLRTYSYELLTEEEKISFINSKSPFRSMMIKYPENKFTINDIEGWDYFNWIAQHLDIEFYEKYELLFDKDFLKEERRYNSEK